MTRGDVSIQSSLRELFVSTPSYTTTLVIIAVSWTSWYYYHSQTRKLSHIPSVGCNAPILSLLSSIYLIFTGRQKALEGSKRYGLFKFPEVTSWVVIAGARELMEDISRAPEHILSVARYHDDLLQGKYTYLSSTVHERYQTALVRHPLTKSIPLLVGDVYDEVKEALGVFIPETADWTPIAMHDTITHVTSRIMNRIFVGKPLCQNQEYINTNVKFLNEIMKVAYVLPTLPAIVRPFVCRCISNIPRLRDINRRHLYPLFDARRRAIKEKGQEYEGKPMDFLSWLMDAAKGDQATDEALMMMIFSINFGATHTSSINIIHAVYHLATNPAYVQLLRDEAEGVIARLGWTKQATDELLIADSFLKECQRMHPNGHTGLMRTAVQDFTFSNGATVPKGTVIGASIVATHFDGEVYSDPDTFDPLRFIKLEAASNQEGSHSTLGRNKYDLTSVGLDSLIWGHGRHACPGRFFAAVELKMVLAYVVLHYDMKMEVEGVRPSDLSLGLTLMPNLFTKVLFRKRQT